MLHLSRKEFDGLVEAAIAALPPEFAGWLEEVPVIVEDRPKERGKMGPNDDGQDAVLGLFQGLDRLEGQEGGALPARISIYRAPLMQACRTREELAEEVRKTLIHELGHYAGMEEGELEARGYGAMDGEEMEWDVDPPSEGPAAD